MTLYTKPHLLRLLHDPFSIQTSSQNICVAFEYAPLGDLNHYLARVRTDALAFDNSVPTLDDRH